MSKKGSKLFCSLFTLTPLAVLTPNWRQGDVFSLRRFCHQSFNNLFCSYFLNSDKRNLSVALHDHDVKKLDDKKLKGFWMKKKIGNIKKLDGKLCYQVFDRSNCFVSGYYCLNLLLIFLNEDKQTHRYDNNPQYVLKIET